MSLASMKPEFIQRTVKYADVNGVRIYLTEAAPNHYVVDSISSDESVVRRYEGYDLLKARVAYSDAVLYFADVN